MQLTAHEMTEARNVARKVSHRPAFEIAIILNERMRLKGSRRITDADVSDLLKGN